MAYSIEWFVDQQIILTRYWGAQDEEEVINSVRQVVDMVNTSDSEFVHILNDVSNLEKPVPFLKMLNIMRNQEYPSKPGWIITIGERNAFVRFVIGGVTSISNRQIRSLKTLDEAVEFIRQADSSIQWDEVHE